MDNWVVVLLERMVFFVCDFDCVVCLLLTTRCAPHYISNADCPLQGMTKTNLVLVSCIEVN